MKTILAGYNVDTSTIKDLEAGIDCSNKVTPETISAAYARISRDARPVNELREVARGEVEKARKSNENIIFSMGHSSVAEHAVFNFDVLGISRLAVEELEHFRLASFTEKSQRYITLDDDFVVPNEIKGTNLEEKYISIIKKQNTFYHKAYEKIREYIFIKHKALAEDPKNKNLLEGWAKEDARYIVALATEGQLGMTVNARTLENMLRRFSAHPIAEVKELGDNLYACVKDIAPSVIRYTKATEYETDAYKFIKQTFDEMNVGVIKKENLDDVCLVNTNNNDEILLTAIIQQITNTTFEDAKTIAKGLDSENRKKLIFSTGKYLKMYSPMLREFEFPDFVFEMTISASCFAQLKRHRMSTITVQPYDISLGVTIPENIINVGLKDEFMQIIDETNELYKLIYQVSPIAAAYILTNAHKRRVLMKINARALYHFIRLREDAHAQWDIRNVSTSMKELVKKDAPLTSFLVCGKHLFEENYNKIYK